MSNLKPESIVTLLKYLDIDFLTEDQYEEICDLNINDEEQQLKVIKAVIVPGFNSLNDREQQSMMKVLNMCLGDNISFTGVFVSISLPFENEIIDKKNFFRNILKEISNEL
ncbi:hypothetical protein QUF95_30935 [Paenibacillus silvae]|uniref:hypothetical protein n=1 Tax=Paenibacillus silvae TaxID=1325358 RepID=UPI0025A13B93|nr:hypothetical protein [Paenibacillus silvae]MDM5281755.1 hypothetical protein [Paenibacillus silvae]